ncbi:MAG: histidinol dehydrogenase, partial [Candidatus Brocadiales bacterium]|nr:histidinol dehydrogenase [Candidatus Brocadiales bacterium]
MRILRAWECNIGREIEKLKKQLSVLDGLSANRQTVLKIIDDVRRQGDSAIVKYSKRFDKVSLSTDKFKVKSREIEAAYRKILLTFVKSIQRAIANIKRYQEHIKIRNVKPLRANGIILDTIYTPIDSVGVYVPGGSASYPSTVLMNAIP